MKRKQKPLLILFFAVIIMALLPGSLVLASEKKAASIGGKTYASLGAAVKKVKKGQTIKLRANIILSGSQSLQLNRNTSYTIDLNGKKIKSRPDGQISPRLIVNKGKVTLKNGTIEPCIQVNQGAALTIQSGAYQNLRNDGRITIRNGTFANSKGILPNVIDNRDGGILTVRKAKVRSYSGCCIINRAKGRMTLAGGTYKNTDEAGGNVLQNLGKAVIRGGTFTGPSSGKGSPLNNLGSVTITGGRLINPAVDRTSYDPAATAYGHISNSGRMTIKGGTITVKKATRAILSTGTLTIKGGRIESYGSRPKNGRRYWHLWTAVVEAYRGRLTAAQGTIYSKKGRALYLAPGVKASVSGVKISAPCTGLVK